MANTSTVKISGKVENLQTLMNVLALKKGDDLLFPFRKLVAQRKTEPTSRLLGRQLAGAGTIYSQIYQRPPPVGEESFLIIEGEGDIILDMAKALDYTKELATFSTGFIEYDTATGRTVYGSIVNDNDKEEFVTRAPGEAGANIDDGRSMLGIPCECNGNPACTKCKGVGLVPSPALTFSNVVNIVPPDTSMYAHADVQLAIDSSIMRAIGDKTALFQDDTFPIKFEKDCLVVAIADQNDITKDSFRKVIPVQYVTNDMVGEDIHLGEFYKYAFNNLTGALTLYTARLPPQDKSVYVTMNKPGGFHCGVQIQAKLDVKKPGEGAAGAAGN